MALIGRMAQPNQTAAGVTPVSPPSSGLVGRMSADGLNTPEPIKESGGIFSKLGKFVGRMAIGIGKSFIETGVRSITSPRSPTSPIHSVDPTGLITKPIIKKYIPEEVSVPIAGDVSIRYSDKTPKQIGQIGEDILNVATAGAGAGMVKNAVTTVAKEGAGEATKEIVNMTGRLLAKRALADFGIGAGVGVSTALQEPDITPENVVKSAATAGAINTVLPFAAGAAVKVGSKVIGGASKAAGEVIENAATRLEKKSNKAFVADDIAKMTDSATEAINTTPGLIPRQPAGAGQVISEIPQNIPKRYYEETYNQPKTFGEKVAGVTAGALRSIQNAPQSLATLFLDRYAAVKNFSKKAKAAGIDTPDLLEMAQGTHYRAAGIAENRLDDYLAMRDTYGNDWQKVKEYSHYLDDLDRLSQGNTIARNRTTEQVVADLEALQKSLTAEQFAKVKQGQEQLQAFLNTELENAVQSGRLSREGYNQIKEAHPNYIPHNVLDYLDEGGTKGGKTLNVAKSGIEKAKGSAREIDDIDNAIVDRLYRQNLLNEKNKTMNALIDTGVQMGERGGFVAERTAEQVAARNEAVNELRKLRDEADRIRKTIGMATEKDNVLVKRLNELNGEIDVLSKKAIDTFLAEPAEDQAIVKQLLTIKEDTRPATKQAEKEVKNIAEQTIELSTKTKERARVLTQDIAEQERSVEKARAKYDEKRVRIADGEKTTVAAEQRAYQREQNKLITMLQEKEYVLSSGDVVYAGAPKLAPKITVKLKQIEPSPKTAIEKNIVKKNNNTVEELKNRIATREQKLATIEANKQSSEQMLNQLYATMQEKKKQIGEMLDEVKANQDKRLKTIDIPAGYERVSRMKNGIREDWLVPEDLGRAVKNMDAEETSVVMSWLNNTLAGKIITAPARAIRKLATGVNPVFAMFSNPARDAQTIALTANVGIKDIAKGLIKTIAGKEDKELYRLARESGALQGSIYREGLKPEAVLLRKIGSAVGGEKQSLFGKVVRVDKAIENAGQATEEMSRLVVFKKALQDGKTAQEAAKLARNSTVDFGKSGTVVQVLNKVIPFLNARVQGFSNLVSSIKNNPEQATRKLLLTGAYPAAILNAYNAKYTSYQNIPDYEKRKYWIVMVGETEGRDYQNKPVMTPHYIKIPKGEAQQAISNITERIVNAGREKYPDSTNAFLLKLVGDISPVTESSILPAGLQQAIELDANYSLYRQKPIEPEYTKIDNKWYKTKEIPAQYRATNSTSEIAKALGEALGWSPAKVDYVIKQGVLNDVIRVGDLSAKGFKNKEGTAFDKASEFPFLRNLIGNSNYGKTEQQKNNEQQKMLEKNQTKIERKKTPNASVFVGRLAK